MFRLSKNIVPKFSKTFLKPTQIRENNYAVVSLLEGRMLSNTGN